MPARLDRVEVQTAQRVVVITWEERERLLARLLTPDVVPRGRTAVVPESRREIVRAFTAVGASRPVSLTAGQRDELLAVLSVFDLALDHCEVGARLRAGASHGGNGASPRAAENGLCAQNGLVA